MCFFSPIKLLSLSLSCEIFLFDAFFFPKIHGKRSESVHVCYEESKRYFLSYAKEMAEVCDGGYWSEYVHYSPFGKNFDGYPEHFNY